MQIRGNGGRGAPNVERELTDDLQNRDEAR